MYPYFFHQAAQILRLSDVLVSHISQGYSCYYFLNFVHLWWFGVLGLRSYIGFLGFGVSVDGVWGLWCGALWVFLGTGLSTKT